MRPPTPMKMWAQQVLRLGPSRLALAVAVLFALLALASPLWSITQDQDGDREVSSFYWTTRTQDRFENGVWDGTEILPYSSSRFAERSIAGALGTAYILDVVLILVLVVVFALFSMEHSRTMPALSLLIVSLLVVGVALLALLFPVVAIPGAATTDFGTFTVGGFWGSWRTSVPPADWSWGAGLGWWLLFIAVLLGIVGAALPYVRSVRAMGPPAPRSWQPPST